jgi:glycerol kinase
MERETGVRVLELRADGGPTANAFLMQAVADVLDRPVAVSRQSELTAYGAALMAGIGCGALSASDTSHLTPSMRRYEPQISGDRRESSWARWRAAVDTIADYAGRSRG